MLVRTCVACLLTAAVFVPALHASGPLGIYAMVEKVVFEPDEARAERVHVWGAFALVDRQTPQSLTTSKAALGHLYFRLPTTSDPQYLQQVRREWADLKAVAGTGQAVGFGTWRYVGRVNPLEAPTSGSTALRILLPSEPAGQPILYQTDSGVVKLPSEGSHATIVGMLRGALQH